MTAIASPSPIVQAAPESPRTPTLSELPGLVDLVEGLVVDARKNTIITSSRFLGPAHAGMGAAQLVLGRALAIDKTPQRVKWALRGSAILAHSAEVKLAAALALPKEDRAGRLSDIQASVDSTIRRVRQARALLSSAGIFDVSNERPAAGLNDSEATARL